MHFGFQPKGVENHKRMLLKVLRALFRFILDGGRKGMCVQNRENRSKFAVSAMMGYHESMTR